MRHIADKSKMTVAHKRFDTGKLLDKINDAYLEGRRVGHTRAKKSFAPSNVGYGAGTCPRRWFYDFTGGFTRIDETDAMSMANMAYGTEAHARLQKLFGKTDVLVDSEREVVSEEPPIFGFADLVIDWQGEETVGEIKTTTEASFISKKNKNAPAGYHLLQVLIYMKVLGLNKGFLLYENKNSQELLLLPVTWNVANKKLIDDTFEWMNMVRANWRAGKLPKRPFKSEKSVVCKTCPYLQFCWKDEEGVVMLPTLVVPK